MSHAEDIIDRMTASAILNSILFALDAPVIRGIAVIKNPTIQEKTEPNKNKIEEEPIDWLAKFREAAKKYREESEKVEEVEEKLVVSQARRVEIEETLVFKVKFQYQFFLRLHDDQVADF